MITFGYSSRFSGPLRALVFIALGIMLVVTKANAMELVVKVVAAFILASGLVSFILGYKKRQDGSMPLLGFNALVNIVIAVLLFLFSGPASRLISYLIGITLFGFGLFQIIVLFSDCARRPFALIIPIRSINGLTVNNLLFGGNLFLLSKALCSSEK